MIQDGNQNTATDLLTSMIQRLWGEAGDTLDWDKRPGRAETSALWTPSSWEASPHHHILKDYPGCMPSPAP
jgi:hypothetical protein